MVFKLFVNTIEYINPLFFGISMHDIYQFFILVTIINYAWGHSLHQARDMKIGFNCKIPSEIGHYQNKVNKELMGRHAHLIIFMKLYFIKTAMNNSFMWSIFLRS